MQSLIIIIIMSRWFNSIIQWHTMPYIMENVTSIGNSNILFIFHWPNIDTRRTANDEICVNISCLFVYSVRAVYRMQSNKVTNRFGWNRNEWNVVYSLLTILMFDVCVGLCAQLLWKLKTEIHQLITLIWTDM